MFLFIKLSRKYITVEVLVVCASERRMLPLIEAEMSGKMLPLIEAAAVTTIAGNGSLLVSCDCDNEKNM